MQKRFIITVLTLLLTIILTFTVHISFVNASPVTLSMDTLPENQGWTVVALGNYTTYVSNGILTVENSAHFEYHAPNDWSNTVNNTKGWIIEFRMRIDPITFSLGNSAPVYVTIGDKRHHVGIYFSRDSIYSMEEQSEYFMNSTSDTFHIYRIISKGDIVRVFVDGKLAINTIEALSPSESNSAFIAIRFGGNYQGQTTKSYWDYFSYDTNPSNLTLTSPTLTFPALTVVNGTSSYYVSNLSGVTLDNFPSNFPIPNGTYAGWCVDKSIRMTRNEAHNISLYSTINSTLPYGTETFNWNAVNYILNHKQGSMQEIQDAIWYFVPDFVSPPTNEANAMAMINAASANSNYVPGNGDIMAVIAYAGHPSSTSASGRSGVQNTILEYMTP